MRSFFSLSKKAFMALVFLLLPILVAFFVGYKSNKDHLTRLIFTDLTVIAEAYEGQVYQFLKMSGMRAQDFASDGLIREQLHKIVKGDKSAVDLLNEHLIKNKKPLDKTIHDIHIVSLGRIVASTDISAIGKELPGESLVMNSGGQPAVKERSYTGSPSLLISVPVTNRTTGNTIGILVNLISMTELDKVMTGEINRDLGALSWDKGRPETMAAYLINKDRLMITESRLIKEAGLEQTVDTLPVRACLESKREISEFYTDYRGKEVAGVSMCIPSLNWTLLVETEKDEVLAPVAKIKRDAIIASVFVAALLGFLFVIFSRNIMRPLSRMVSAAKDIAGGKYDVRIPVQTSDEIGVLSEAFNTMASDIKTGIDILRAGTIALKESEDSLKSAQRIAHLGNWDWDIVRNKLSWSMEIYRIFGLDPLEFGATYDAFFNSVHPDDRELVKKSVDEVLSGGGSYSIDHRIVRPDGAVRIVHEQAEVIFNENKEPVRMAGTIQDITEHKQAEAELRKLSMAIEHSVDIVFITDANGNIEYVNPMFEQVTGWSKEEVMGKNPRFLASGKTSKEEYQEMWRIIGAGKTWRGVFKNRTKGGEFYWGNGVISPIKNERGEITHFLAVQEDITEKKKTEERIRYLASYDETTGLVNRARFMDMLSEWIYAESGDQGGVLLLIDIDEFKFLNDTYGHGVGDELLRRIAGLLQETIKEAETAYLKKADGVILGRMGGDEFTVFLPYAGTKEGVEAAEKIRKKVEAFRIQEVPIHLTVSIGMVSYPEHGFTTKELFTKVDAAMYRAKEMGRNRCHLYRPEDRDLENINSRLNEKERINKALSEDRFLPWFQPILCLKDDKIHHYEALARMLKKDESVLLPGEFIDTAERFGLIGAIDRVITEKTMRLQVDAARQGRNLCFAMNISGKNLGDEEFLSFLQSGILETGADPGCLLFEITETAAVRDLDRAIKFINALKSIGCHFSLDDFGVGFTSFIYLKELQVDYIKIDGSFIKRLHESDNDQLFVKAMTDVAKGMGIKTVAEFVEKEETLELLKKLGVDYAQGYLIGKPGPELLS